MAFTIRDQKMQIEAPDLTPTSAINTVCDMD